MSETWYEAFVGGATINPVEVDKVTASFVHVVGRRGRDGISTDWRSYFRTRDEAVEWIVGEAKKRVDNANRQLDHAERELAKAMALRGEP